MAHPGAGENLKVFISYSRRDSVDFADELVAGLKLAGFAPFLDRHDVAPGDEWEERLGGLIAQSDTVVFVISPEAVKSERCVWEVDRTNELSKRLLPVIFKPVPEHEIPKGLSRLQFVRFDTGRGITRPLAELAEALRQDLDWIREHTRLGEIATRWERRDRSDSLLLRGDDLDAAKAWMVARKVGAPEITDAQRALIGASEEAEAKRLGNERAQLEREKAQVAEIKTAQARTTRLQRITRWAFVAIGAVILIAAGVVAYQAKQLATKEATLTESEQQLGHARASVSAEQASNAALNETLNRRQVEIDHAQANILAELSASKLSGGNYDIALRLASRGTRIDLALPADKTRASPAAAALAAAVSQANWRFALGGHDDAVNSAAFSPDGSRIVTASDDKTARIWDVASAKEIAVLRGHDSRVNSAAFSPDGSRIVTASWDGTARIWDAAAAKEIVALRGHENSVLSAAFSPDGKRIVTTSWDETARIWDAASTKEIAVLRGHDSRVNSAAFSRDGKRIVTTSYDKTGRIWDAVSAKNIAVLRGHDSEVRSAAFSRDGKRIVTASEDMTARIWDAVSAKNIAVLRGHTHFVHSAAFSPDGSRIVTASDDKTVRIWDAVSAKEIAVLRGHDDQVWSAAFSPDGSRIVTASEDKTVRIWDAASAKQIAVLRGHENSVLSAAFSPDGSRIVTTSHDATARIWDAASAREIAVLRGHDGAVFSAAFSPDGSRIVTASWDGTARIWDAHLQTMMVKDLLAQACARLAVTKLTREEMLLASYPDSVPEIDVCTSGQ
jgi:WD40 repeat protein